MGLNVKATLAFVHFTLLSIRHGKLKQESVHVAIKDIVRNGGSLGTEVEYAKSHPGKQALWLPQGPHLLPGPLALSSLTPVTGGNLVLKQRHQPTSSFLA